MAGRTAKRKVKIETQADFEAAYPDYGNMLAEYHERVRRRAEKTIRRAIKTEYRRRLFKLLSRPTGAPPKQRYRDAKRNLGIGLEEVSGGVLGLGVVMAVSDGEDIEQFYGENGSVYGSSILPQAEDVGCISVVPKAIEDAWRTVSKPARLKRAEEALGGLEPPASSSMSEEELERLRNLRRRRRRPLKPLPPRAERRLPPKYSHEYPVRAGGHGYMVNAIPTDIWNRAKARAHGEGIAIRTVIIRALDLYAKGHLNLS
jgi:hypothetical protein